MNWLGFIAAVIQAVAWPLVVVIVALVFRAELRGLLRGPLQRLKVGPLEAEWNRVLAALDTEIGSPTPTRSQPDKGFAELQGLAEKDPDRAVFEAHERIVKRLQEMTGQEIGEPPLAATAASLARVAADRGRIAPATLRAIEGITLLRNLAAHGGPGSVTPERAAEYVAYAEMILWVLDQPMKQTKAQGASRGT
jgi:hypothetical protein